MNISTLISRLKKEGVRLSVKSGQLNVEASKTPSEELIFLLRENKDNLIEALTASSKVQKAKSLIFSPEQESIWLAQNNNPEGLQYHFPSVFELKGKVNEKALETALLNIVRKHSALRMVAKHNGVEFLPTLVNIPATILDVLFFDNEDEAQSAIDSFLSQPFDLESDILIKAALISCGKSTKLCLLTHHIASDGWSVELFFKELGELYSEALINPTAEHSEIEVSYSDITYHNSLIDYQNSEYFWSNVLKNCPISSGLKSSLKKDNNIQAGIYKSTLTYQEMNDVRSVSDLTGASIFTVIQSFYAYALSLYSGNSSVLLGSPVSGRELPESHGVIGCFTKVMPFNICFTPEDSLSQVIERNHTTLTKGSGFPLPPLQKLLSLAKDDEGHTPSIETSFTLHPSDELKLELEGLTATKITEDFMFSRFDIELHAVEGDNFGLTWVYNKSVIAEDTPESLASLLKKIIHVASSQISTPLCKINWLSNKARPENSTSDNTVCSKFFDAVNAYSDKVAVSSLESKWTYKELDEKSNQIARYLKNNISESNASGFVGIVLSRTAWSLAAMLGVLKSGNAFVPIDQNYSESKVSEILDIADINFVITTSDCYQKIDTLLDKDVLLLDEDYREAMLGSLSCSAVVESVKSSDPAYVMFTSGTTGKPKGVTVPHCAIVRLTEETTAFSFDSETCMLHGSAQNFDASTLEIWGPLLNGGRVAVYEDHLSSIATLNKFMLTQNVTSMWMTSGLFSEWVGLTDNSLSLNQIIVGGDVVSPSAVLQCYDKYPKSKIINGYGPTENTTFTCCYSIPKVRESVSIPIGKPINGTSCFVADPITLNILPHGAAGELIAAGEGLAIGYLNDFRRTEESFVNIDLDNRNSVRGYRTGDIVRALPSGDFEYLGRQDNQVKVRGFRIELSEVSNTFEKINGIDSSFALYDEKSKGLRVFLTVTSETEKEVKVLRNYSENMLPPHAQPQSFTFVDNIPLNANGKVDHKLLLELKPESESCDASEPESPTEVMLMQIWKDSLEIEKLSVTDNFFNIGGDSIKAIKVVSKCEKSGLYFGIKDIFEHKTVRSLAQMLDSKNYCKQKRIGEQKRVEKYSLLNASEIDEISDINDIEDAYPLTELQKGMAYHHSVRPEMYHDIVSFNINEKYSHNEFSKVLGELVTHYEILRTFLKVSVGRGIQCVKNGIDLPLNVIDLQMKNEKEQSEFLSSWQESLLSSSLDLDSLPWGITIFLIAPERFRYSINFHHSIFDGWSMATFNSYLFKRYMNALNGMESEAITPHEPFSTYVRQEIVALELGLKESYLSEISNENRLPWWKDEISGHNSSVSLTFDESRMKQIKKLSMRYGLQDKALLFGAYSVLLAKMNGQKNVLTSVVVNARPEVDGSDKTLGLFLNSLPTLTPDTDQSWYDYLQSINNIFTQHQDMKQYPMSEIQLKTGLKYDASLFNYVDFHVYDDLIDAISVEGFDIYEKTNYGLQFLFARNPQDNTLMLNILSDCRVFDEEFLGRLAEEFFSILDSAEYSDIVVTENMSISTIDGKEKEKKGTYLEQFAAMVIENPEAVCAIDDNGSLSYEQVDILSDRLACFLTDAGLEKNDVVGVSLSSSSHVLISIIAIWKSGAVYLPIDPDTPDDRKEYMLKNSDAACCIVDGTTGIVSVDELDISGHLHESSWMTEYEDEELQVESSESAYIIYTSGTTGKPKGVSISHEALSGYLSHTSREYFSKADAALVLTSINFDATVTSLIGPSYCGKCTVFSRDKKELLERESRSRTPTLFKITPSQLSIFLDDTIEGAVNTPHVFIIGGEPLGKDLLLSLFEHYPNAICVNEYGPTEATVGTTTFTLTKENFGDLRGNEVPIGRPIDGAGVAILGRDGLPVMSGCVGELFILGEMLSCGYINNTEQTKQSFPLMDLGNGLFTKTYKTGDMASLDIDGNLYFHGRKDNQIKHNGVRIELSEVKAVIEEIVGGSSVSVIYDKAKSQIICALIDNSLCIDNIISEAEKFLPSYMLPSLWGFIDSVPLTINGKEDKDKIAEMIASQMTANIKQESTTELQGLLMSLVSDITGYPAVTLDSKFMEVGGDSLKVMSFLSQIKSRFSVSLQLSDLLENQSVRKLSALIEQEQAMENLEDIDNGDELIF